eukprot:ctg_2572.g632
MASRSTLLSWQAFKQWALGPTGLRTTHAWGPISNAGLPLSGLADLQKPPEYIAQLSAARSAPEQRADPDVPVAADIRRVRSLQGTTQGARGPRGTTGGIVGRSGGRCARW